MDFIRVESIEGSSIFAIFRITPKEYAHIIEGRNLEARRAEIERLNEVDRERERQWYVDHEANWMEPPVKNEDDIPF